MVAGASEGKIYGIALAALLTDGLNLVVYDIESRRVSLKVTGHDYDVNAVCFADQSSNVIYSGSDDGFIKVWDRRSMRDGKPAGILVGHTEGITFVASKGDGRYALSNGKDQTMRLWDIRKMHSDQDRETLRSWDYMSGFDYRYMEYPGASVAKHPQDCSVVTYRGHSVLKTLIRCNFAPVMTTGQQYVYSGSEDGRVHIYNLDGTVCQVLDVSDSLSRMYHLSGYGSMSPGVSRHFDDFSETNGQAASACVRDVSWHPFLPVIASTAWTSLSEAEGVVMVHEF